MKSFLTKLLVGIVLSASLVANAQLVTRTATLGATAAGAPFSTNLFETTNVVLLTSLEISWGNSTNGTFTLWDGWNTNTTTRSPLTAFGHGYYSNATYMSYGGHVTNITINLTNFARTDPAISWDTVPTTAPFWYTNAIKTNVWVTYTNWNVGGAKQYRIVSSLAKIPGANPTTTIIDETSPIYITKGLNLTNSSGSTNLQITWTYQPVN